MSTRNLSARRTIAGLTLVAAGLTGGAALATAGTASAADAASTASTASTAAATSSTETALTGATLSSVKAAVLAKYPAATFGKVTTEDTGGYEAHITTAAGKQVTVLVSTAFAVTGTEAHAGHGGKGGGTETVLTGTDLSSVKTAVLAKYPGATFKRVSTEDGGGFEAHITTAAGTATTVLLDKAFAITGTE